MGIITRQKEERDRASSKSIKSSLEINGRKSVVRVVVYTHGTTKALGIISYNNIRGGRYGTVL